ncbi:M56 family metallopeptidase [Niabella pedocola]|uniref:M56 family metallopeptidase n=1 Tax=Niabella pedocola TaxID=1752077 RepID=A0ABS8PW62_9BACT|nr:M56 family metallopeptidase [Niabella pedocola]MCD2425311.1 M56 family metallopeptidase [Niabella pedocola]
MILYLLKVIACSGLLYAFYYGFLQKEKMLVFNRFYLLGTMLCSFLIPLAVIEVRLKAVVLQPSTGAVISPVPEIVSWPELLTQWAFAAAGVVSVVLLLRFVWQLYQMQQRLKGNEQRVFEGATLVLPEVPVTPHSFFNYIILNKADFDSRRIETAILIHELAHVRQKHTWDIVLAEFMGALMWFNPFLRLYRRAIRLNHEFLADQAAAGGQEQRVAYQQLLLKSIYVNQSIPLASSFYFLTTKKRLLMLQQETNRFRTGIKAIVVAPVLVLLIFTFAERVYTQELPPPPPKVPKEQKMPEDIKSLSVITPKGKAVAVLTYRNGKTVKADISSAEKQAAFESKYGVEIPPPPPPPPPPKAPKEQKMPEDIKGVSVIAPQGKAVAVLTYKNGKTVRADISSAEKQAAFESRYGVEIPPPPPPTVPVPTETPAVSASPAIFVAEDGDALVSVPKQQLKFVAESLPAVPTEKRVAPVKRVQAIQPLAPVPADGNGVKELKRFKGR